MSDTLRVGTMSVEEEEPTVEQQPETTVDDSPEFTYDDLSIDDELWEGGPTLGEIEEWKKEHGAIYVTSVTPGDHFVWRTIKRSEYRNIVKELERRVSSGTVSQAEATMDNEEMIASACILAPEVKTFDGDMAGVAAIISQEVLEASGFQALEVRQL